MKLWTIQPIEVVDILNEKGIFICNPNLSENLNDEFSFTSAYNWLVKEMEKKIGKRPINVSFPIWAWHTENGCHKKPDLRFSGHAKRGTKLVCIEIEVSDNEVVLSDFDAWHYVLNNSYFDDSKNEEEWEQLHKWFDGLSPEQQEKEKIKSWHKIFDITKYKNDWASNGYFVQATCWELKKEYVKKLQYFTAK